MLFLISFSSINHLFFMLRLVCINLASCPYDRKMSLIVWTSYLILFMIWHRLIINWGWLIFYYPLIIICLCFRHLLISCLFFSLGFCTLLKNISRFPIVGPPELWTNTKLWENIGISYNLLGNLCPEMLHEALHSVLSLRNPYYSLFF